MDIAATAAKYPTLTSNEAIDVAALDARIAEATAEQAALMERLADLRAQRKALLETAALRAVTPEEVSLTYRTTGQGGADLKAIVAEAHPYIDGFRVFGPYEQKPVLGVEIHLTDKKNDPAQVEPLAQALLDMAALIAPDGGLAYEIDPVTGQTVAPSHHVDHTWWEHADGMHPVDVIEDDLSENRSFLIGHTSDGARAVLIDRFGWWQYRDDRFPKGVVTTGTLTEVLRFVFNEARNNVPKRDEGERW